MSKSFQHKHLLHLPFKKEGKVQTPSTQFENKIFLSQWFEILSEFYIGFVSQPFA